MMPCIACLRGWYAVGTQIQISYEPILIALIVIIPAEFWSTAVDAGSFAQLPEIAVIRNREYSENSVFHPP